MLRTVLVLSTWCTFVQGSGIAHSSGVVPAVPVVAPQPIVTAASSQYFERTFNRLVATPPILEPVIPIAPVSPVVPIAPPQSVFIQPVTKTTVLSVAPENPTNNVPIEPNVAIAVATAHAAAPVATILLPPYPFGPPPSFGFVPSNPPFIVPGETKNETVINSPPQVSTQATTLREPEPTTPQPQPPQLPQPSNIDNNFIQGLPSNQNTNLFKQHYGPPLPLPQDRHLPKPQKLKTLVEIVPVPLTYIAPPPIKQQQFNKLLPIKTMKHIHTFVPTKAKIVIRPVSVHAIRVPAKIIYRIPVSARNVNSRYTKATLRRPNIRRDIEPTTFTPFTRPNTKPPRL